VAAALGSDCFDQLPALETDRLAAGAAQRVHDRPLQLGGGACVRWTVVVGHDARGTNVCVHDGSSCARCVVVAVPGRSPGRMDADAAKLVAQFHQFQRQFVQPPQQTFMVAAHQTACGFDH